MWCWKLNRLGVYWRFDFYLLCWSLVTKVFVKRFLAVDYNLEYLELEDPLDWPLLMDSYYQNLKNKYFDHQGTTQYIPNLHPRFCHCWSIRNAESSWKPSNYCNVSSLWNTPIKLTHYDKTKKGSHNPQIKLKISLKSVYAHLLSNWYLILTYILSLFFVSKSSKKQYGPCF